MDSINIRSNLKINLINTILSIKFNEEIYKDENKSIIDKDDLKLYISDGICKITDYELKTEDNQNFVFFLKLDLASDGEQLIFLKGKVFNNQGINLKIYNECVNLNKEYLYLTGDSVIKTDQGDIKIENIEPYKYSINDEKIIEINKGIDINITNLILFKKSSISYNVPSCDIYLRNNQKIYYKNKYMEVHEIFFKYNNDINLELVNYENRYLYGIVTDKINFIEVNNLKLELNNNNNLYIENYNLGYTKIESLIEQKIEEKYLYYDNKNDEILNYNNKKYLYYDKKIEELNNLIKKKNNNININKKKIEELNNLIKKINNNNINEKKININENNNENIEIDKLIFYHWLKNGYKDKKYMYPKLVFENADLEKYKKDYPFISGKLKNDLEIWKHWNKNAVHENKKMYIKINNENADYDRFIIEYKDISNKLNNDNDKIWNYYCNNKYNINIYHKIDINNADIERYKKDYPHLIKRICNIK